MSMPFPLTGSQFNIAQFQKAARHFGSTVLRCYQAFPIQQTCTQKRTARFWPAVQVREETPGKGSDRGLSPMFILQIKVSRALTGLNSCTHFFCTHFGFRLASTSSRAAADDIGCGLPEYARTRNNDARQGGDDPLDVASARSQDVA
jgi:hypothetical protein